MRDSRRGRPRESSLQQETSSLTLSQVGRRRKVTRRSANVKGPYFIANDSEQGAVSAAPPTKDQLTNLWFDKLILWRKRTPAWLAIERFQHCLELIEPTSRRFRSMLRCPFIGAAKIRLGLGRDDDSLRHFAESILRSRCSSANAS
jgi:hypothetical protein